MSEQAAKALTSRSWQIIKDSAKRKFSFRGNSYGPARGPLQYLMETAPEHLPVGLASYTIDIQYPIPSVLPDIRELALQSL